MNNPANPLEQLIGILYELFLVDFADFEPQQFTIPLNPVPASRPRVSQFATYYGARYTKFKELAVGPCNSFTGKKTGQPVAAFVEHVIEAPAKPGKLAYPEGDIDNYDKAPLDAMVKSGRFFEDDVQVVFLASAKRYARPGESPGVHVTWFDFPLP